MDFVVDDVVRQGFGFANPNHAAAAICALFPFCWGWGSALGNCALPLRVLLQWAGRIAGVALCVMLAMTHSRTGFVVLAIEAIAMSKCKVENVKCKIGERAILSLGDCNGQIAKVVLNGRDLGTAWCEPYEVEIPSGVLKDGENVLEIEFTNVWANRLIGDEQEPSDCDFAKAPFPGGQYLTRFPDWFKNGLATRPSKGRKCFTDWNYFDKDSRLIPSGLLGPIKIVTRKASE